MHTWLAGASGARHSLRPLIGEGGTFEQTSRETRGEIAKLCLPKLCLPTSLLFEIKVGVHAKTLVMPGLDPGIHPSSQESVFEKDGLPGQARQ
jgi:hypothetical protein